MPDSTRVASLKSLDVLPKNCFRQVLIAAPADRSCFSLDIAPDQRIDVRRRFHFYFYNVGE